MKTLKERIEIETALLNGETVQEFLIGDLYSKDCSENHIFYWNCCDYRIKPEPLEFWVAEYVNNSYIYKENEKETALENARIGSGFKRLIKVREVIEE